MFTCLTAAELRAGGLSSYQITLAEGCCMRRVRRGVYVVTKVCDDPAHRFASTVAAAPDTTLPKESSGMRKRDEDLRILVRSYVGDLPSGATFSHCSALIVYGLPIPYLEKGEALRVEAVHPGCGVRRRAMHIRRRPLRESEVTNIDGIRVTSLPRTLFDLARDYPLAFTVAVVDSALRRSLISMSEFQKFCAGRSVRTRGARIRAVIENVDPRRESLAESISAVRFLEYSVPGFEPQVEIRDENGNFVARTDFANKCAQVIAEFDGAGKYYLDGIDPQEAFELERKREYLLRNLGYTVFRLTWADLFRADLFLRIRSAVEQRTKQQG